MWTLPRVNKSLGIPKMFHRMYDSARISKTTDNTPAAWFEACALSTVRKKNSQWNKRFSFRDRNLVLNRCKQLETYIANRTFIYVMSLIKIIHQLSYSNIFFFQRRNINTDIINCFNSLLLNSLFYSLNSSYTRLQ